MKINEMQVQVRIPCETCGATGTSTDPIPGSAQSHGGQPMYWGCADCKGTGATSTEWMSLRALSELIAQELPSVVRNATNARHF